MHIILGLLGLLVTILVLLNKLQENGLDVGWLNPFSWQRRRKYRIEHDLNPAFKLDSPMDVAALFMVAVAKVDGDFSKEQKACILSLFGSEFHLSQAQAHALLSSSVHLLGQTEDVYRHPEKVITRVYDKFQPEQSRSIGLLIDQVAEVEGNNSSAQRSLVNKIKQACPAIEMEKW